MEGKALAESEGAWFEAQEELEKKRKHCYYRKKNK